MITEALKTNGSLTALDMDCEDGKNISRMVSENRKLICTGNSIGAEECRALQNAWGCRKGDLIVYPI